MQGKAVIFTAPSGAGKTTIVRHLLENDKRLAFSISGTTRPIREGEIGGKDYHFFSPEDFKIEIEKGNVIEWEEVYEGRYYGTLKSEVERLWSEGKTVLFDVDVKGARSLKDYFGESGIAIFVKPPSLEELKKRLINRGTENEESLRQRLARMDYELSKSETFDRVVINDILEDAIQESRSIVDEFLRINKDK